MITAGLVKKEDLVTGAITSPARLCQSALFDNGIMGVQAHLDPFAFHLFARLSSIITYAEFPLSAVYWRGQKRRDCDAGEAGVGVDGAADEWADVLVPLLLYVLPLPQGQSRVSVLIGFREERRERRLQTEEKSSTRHMDGLWDEWLMGTDV